MSCSVPSVARALLSARRFKGIGSRYKVLGLNLARLGRNLRCAQGQSMLKYVYYHELTTRTTL